MGRHAVLVLWCILTALASHVQAQRVACVGASITQGYLLSGEDSYPAQLKRVLHQYDRDWEVGNFGVAGTVVLRKAPMTAYMETGEFGLALAWEPGVVVIQLGGNDSLPGNWAYKDDFTTDFVALIDAFLQLPSHPTVYVWVPTPIFWSQWGHDIRALTDEIIPLIRQLPTFCDVQLIDLYTPFQDKSHLFVDGIHPNAEGATSIARIVAGAIVGMCAPPDFNGDWVVNIDDLVILIEHWNRNEPSVDIVPPPSGDGIVDRQDLEALMKYWGRELADPALLAHWKLDETEGTLAQDSADGYDATLHGEPIWQAEGGKVKGALQLDGTEDYVRTEFVLDPAVGPFAIFAWVQGGGPSQVVLSQVGGANWLVVAPDGALMTELTSGRNGPLVSVAVIADGAWHRVGFVRDGLHRILYVDDIEVARDTVTTLTGCTGGLYIGAGKGLEPGAFWSGLIDDVWIYNRAVRP